VLTTNLYGLPDRVTELRARCDRFGIPLIEDAAHAIQTEVDGRPIGSFGAAAFSLSKHARRRGGGAVAFADLACRPRLEARADTAAPRPGGSVVVVVDSLVALVLELLAPGKEDEALLQLETRRGTWVQGDLQADHHLFDRDGLRLLRPGCRR
jgi:hypothetical protein